MPSANTTSVGRVSDACTCAQSLGSRKPDAFVGLVPSLGPFGLLPSWPEPGRGFRPEVGLYWAVAPEHRRRGIAAEAAAALIDHAFAELDLARVVATTERENIASIGVMRRLGMRVEQNPEPEPAWFQVVGILSHDRQG